MPICKECKKEVLPEDFEEEIETCIECIIYAQEAENEQQNRLVQVTREMAIDAGDRSLEGQWIEW